MLNYNGMKYKEFKKIVIDNMPENPIPGLWQGKGAPRKHILGKPSSPKERADLINKYSLLPNVPLVDSGTIHLHHCAHHLNSSQIMCYNFFRPMIEGFDGTMYHPKDDLIKLFGMEVDEELEHKNAVCNFEYIDKSKDNTNFDFYFKSNQIEVFCEIKYTEEWFAKSSSAKDPHERFESVYKPMIDKAKDIFANGSISESVFNTKYYQLARNAIRATSSGKHVFFICPRSNKNLRKQFRQFSTECLTDEGRKRVKLITWGEIVLDAYRLGIDINAFNNRYLAFLPDEYKRH